MELWIRSQDKERLIKIKNIETKHNYTEKEKQVKYLLENGSFTYRTELVKDKYIKSIVYGDGYWLGEYKTKERALEVLDEIQDLMRSLSDTDLKIIQYEMPKD